MDYERTALELIIEPADTEMIANIPIQDDDVPESREFFNVNITLLNAARGVQVLEDEATVFIYDDDGESSESKWKL